MLPVRGARSRGAAAPYSGARAETNEAAVPPPRRRALHRPPRLHLTRGRELTQPQHPQAAAAFRQEKLFYLPVPVLAEPVLAATGTVLVKKALLAHP